ncbi:hypothetical protein A3C23_03730 [Candidatus Roizmanbacteria bacterium RIFCSPHIGHO2_02_FULL_37_13b]|nr:MAG: hypothetical protein A3C23_03730 [Candidatus Roizmanbacteria bacterium RIFCSPHIGHO2_02_FULL_37_13b]
MKKNLKILAFAGSFFMLLFHCPDIHAEEYTTNYETIYTLNENGDASVQLSVILNNQKKATYIKEFTLFFPDEIEVKNVRSKSDLYKILETKRDENGQYQITIAFSQSNFENNKDTHFTIFFDQSKIIKKVGRVSEMFIPLINDSHQRTNTVIVNKLDQLSPLSISKPPPSSYKDGEIKWTDVKQQFIYAIFGNQQYYKISTVYNLINTSLTPVEQTIALPPDTQHQNVLLTSINPLPIKTFSDIDGNFLAKYTVKPNSKLTINYEGYAILTTSSSNEYQNYMKNHFSKQKLYLLKTEDYWHLDSDNNMYNKINRTNPQTIYQFIIDNFDYDFERTKNPVIRLGAQKALINPLSSLCTEFTDTFIAVSRKSGFYAREIQGFGYSFDAKLRPLTLTSDVLHSWPEYYSEQENNWQAIDPTWQRTSGLDYFSSFDLNHIALVIHGQNSTFPKAAGTYKTERSKDLIVTAVKEIPQQSKTIEINHNLRQNILSQKNYSLELQLKNQSNVILKGNKINLTAQHIKLHPAEIVIDYLVPFENKKYIINYQGNPSFDSADNLKIFFDGQLMQSKEINIKQTTLMSTVLLIAGPIIVFIVVALVFNKAKYL